MVRAKPGISRGFTLIELLVVLAVIALVTGLATPLLFRVLPGLQIEATAKNLSATLRRARNAAIGGNRAVLVEIDVAAASYRQLPDGALETLPDGVGIALIAARSEQLDEDRGRIRFYPDGSSTGGRITLFNDSRQLEMRVDWFNGRVLREDGED